MNRRTFAVDRLLVVLLGLALVAVGAWLLAWVLDLLPDGWWDPGGVTLGLSPDVTGATWWVWVLLLGGLLLIAIGGAWLVAHFRRTDVDQLSMPGDAQGGRLLIDGSALASGAAAALVEASPDVADAGGRLVEQRKRLVLSLSASVRPDADLAEVRKACEDVARHAVRSSGREDLAVRTRLRAAPRADRAPRVH